MNSLPRRFVVAKIIFVVLALFCVVVGRIHTFDMTEGQALVEGAVYWVGAFCCGLLAIMLRD